MKTIATILSSQLIDAVDLTGLWFASITLLLSRSLYSAKRCYRQRCEIAMQEAVKCWKDLND